MAHYSIFIPGASGASESLLESVGLDALQSRQSWSWCECLKGPGGQAGVIGTVITNREGSDPLLGYHEDLQTWTPVGNRPDINVEAGKFWYGFETGRSPEPRDLLHHKMLRGRDVLLKDDNVWHVPETLSLPMDIGRDHDTGELVKLYSKEYEDFSHMAEKYVFIFFENIIKLEELREMRPDLELGEINADFELSDCWDYCCRALAINYRVAEPIIGPGMLHLLDDQRMSKVVMATLAFPDILEVIEKKNVSSPVSIPVGLNTSPGE